MSEEKAAEVRLKDLLIRIGEPSQGKLSENLELLADALQEDLSVHGDFITETLITCAKCLPAKASIYGTLAGLLHCESPKFGRDLVRVRCFEAVR